MARDGGIITTLVGEAADSVVSQIGEEGEEMNTGG